MGQMQGAVAPRGREHVDGKPSYMKAICLFDRIGGPSAGPVSAAKITT
jgi:hypothetical protein